MKWIKASSEILFTSGQLTYRHQSSEYGGSSLEIDNIDNKGGGIGITPSPSKIGKYWEIGVEIDESHKSSKKYEIDVIETVSTEELLSDFPEISKSDFDKAIHQIWDFAEV